MSKFEKDEGQFSEVIPSKNINNERSFVLNKDLLSEDSIVIEFDSKRTLVENIRNDYQITSWHDYINLPKLIKIWKANSIQKKLFQPIHEIVNEDYIVHTCKEINRPLEDHIDRLQAENDQLKRRLDDLTMFVDNKFKLNKASKIE